MTTTTGTYEASFNIVADDCGKKPTLFCYIGNEYNTNANGILESVISIV
jgi:hypothetical protein